MRHAKAYSHGKAEICVLARFCLVDNSLSLNTILEQNSSDILESGESRFWPQMLNVRMVLGVIGTILHIDNFF